MTGPEAVRVGLRTLTALAVMGGVYLAIVGAVTAWTLYVSRRHRS